ncbi:hypothetical protein HMPREF0322_04307 [Desulfitobacterium hafniense DP7]|uniref:Uncharacterized protein n=1 Tax=Desulfitobacterium hafniense DP7 TaxID=537010 RepID=G9XTK0_DESHA|nr:hypothetical protein HMPREF0322_04307 [Desulfitobacterium hafniense DP7]
MHIFCSAKMGVNKKLIFSNVKVYLLFLKHDDRRLREVQPCQQSSALVPSLL